MSVFKVLLSGIVATLINTSSSVWASEFNEGNLSPVVDDQRDEQISTSGSDVSQDINEAASHVSLQGVDEVTAQSDFTAWVREVLSANPGHTAIRFIFEDGSKEDYVVASMDSFDRETVIAGRAIKYEFVEDTILEEVIGELSLDEATTPPVEGTNTVVEELDSNV